MKLYVKVLGSEFKTRFWQFSFADNFSSIIKIEDIYKIDEQKEEMLHAYYGLWDSMNGMVTYETNIFHRRSNFQGHTLRY